MTLFYRSDLWRRVTACVIIAMMTALTFSANAQTRTITGKITDFAEGSPVVGASVLVKGTTRGTITDVDGNFSLDAASNDVLLISFIGYQTQEIAVGAQTSIAVELQLSENSLEEVVVVGYGEQKKVNLSGAVDQVDSKVLEARPIQNVAQGLQGTIPNLNIDFNSGEPGGTPNINIRGFTSINGGNPLILVDNVPMDASELNYIAPTDIKTISVLKDASSAAIYGARAAFGVILITTKSGVKDGLTIDYNNNFSWSKPTVLPNKITDPYIYMRLLEISTDNTPWDYVNYSPEQYAYAKQRSDNPGATPPVRLDPNDNNLYEYMGNRDWTKYFLNNYTMSQRQSIAISGKSGKATYYLSGAYDKQNGALKIAEDKFDRYSMRSKVNYKAAEWLSLGNNTVVSLTERSKPYNLSIPALYDLFPTSWDKNPDGTWANTDVGRVGASLTEGGRASNKVNMLQTTFLSELSFLERMFRLNGEFTIRRENANNNSYQSRYNIGFGPNDVRSEGANIAYREAGFDSYYVFNGYGTFEKKADKHFVNAILGFNQEFSHSEAFTARKSGVISSSLPTIGLATGESFVGETKEEWAIRGGFYRLNYIFDDKYIVEFNGRYDGTSKFPKDKRFGFFPSGSVAWRIDEENFWESIKGTVSSLKLRASYGSLGNQFVGAYGYIPSMTPTTSPYMIGGTLPLQLSAPSLVSSNYTWEKVVSRNLGIDLGFLQQRVTASFDIYSRDTKGMLALGKDLPGVLGELEPLQNSADIRVKGWEFSLGYDNEFSLGGKPLQLGAKFILSDYRGYVTKFDNPNSTLTQWHKGMEMGEIWGLKSDGLFQNQEQINALDETQIVPWGALSIVPGWPKYKDLDGNGIIEKGTTTKDPKDLSKIGNITPRYRFGVNLNASWNGFDIRAFIQGVGKADYYPLHYLYWGAYQQPYAGGYPHLLDFYRPTDDPASLRAQHSQSFIDAGLADANLDAKFPIFQAWLADRNLGERIDQAQGLAIPQTGYMLSAAYLRLKNITVGYTFPSSMLERINISRLRVYVSGENLAEISQLGKYFDPEAVNDNAVKVNPTLSTANGWGYAYPFQRRYSFGIELQF